MNFSISELKTMILALQLAYGNALKRGDYERVHSCARILSQMEQELDKQIKKDEKSKKKKLFQFYTKAV